MSTAAIRRSRIQSAKQFDAVGCAAVVSLTLGLALLVSSTALLLICFLTGVNLDRTETALLVLSFCLLGLGAHFMDDRDKKRWSEWK